VVVDQFNIKGVCSFKTENDAPVGPYRDRPQPLHVTFERMQPITGNIQSLWRVGGVENREDSFNRLQQVGTYPAAVAAFLEPFEAMMLEAPNHQGTP